MKIYNKKVGFTFVLSLICFSGISTASNDNYSDSNSGHESFDSRPNFTGDNHSNDSMKPFDSHKSANDNTTSVSPTNTPAPTQPSTAPRRIEK